MRRRGVVVGAGVNRGGGQTYEQRILALEPYAYWPLNEAAGATTALDAVGNYNSSAVANVTFGADGIGDGNTAASFNGVNSLITLPHASMTTTFPKDAGTMAIWMKIAAAVWTDGANRSSMYIGNFDVPEYIEAFEKRTTNNTFYYMRYTQATPAVEVITSSDTEWFFSAISWSVSDNAVKGYINGTQVGTTQTNVKAWSSDPVLNRVRIGDSSGKPFKGSLAHAMLFSRVLTTDELLDLASF